MRPLHRHLHKRSLRSFLTGATQRRRRQKKAGWCALLALTLYAGLGLHDSQAVAPYRSPEDYGPSIEARNHLPACRRAALDSMGGAGKIESETFVQRADAEYFRFVLRNGSKEILIICDGHAGVIRRQIDIWGEL